MAFSAISGAFSPRRREPNSISSPSTLSTSVRACIGAPQHVQALAVRGTTARHSSHSFGRGSLRSRAREPSALPLLAVVEMVLADVRHHAETQMVAGMIEDQKMILALGRAKTSTDRLDEENPALGRLGVDDAAHVQIDAGRQHADIADHARLAGPKAIEDRLAVFAGGRAVHIFGGDARLEESLGDVLRMTAIDAEAEGRPSLSRA